MEEQDTLQLSEMTTAVFDPDSDCERSWITLKTGNTMVSLSAEQVIRLGEWAKERNARYS